MIDLKTIDNIYLCPGSTAMRKNIALLAAAVQYQMHLNPFTTNLYIFCGKSKKVIKILELSNDGFWLHSKKL